jgi:hypothetical protein
MILHTLFGILLCIGAGGAVYGITRLIHSDYKLTGKEFLIGVPIVLVVTFLTSFIGYKVAYSNTVTYHEYWGGYEVQAQELTTTCSEDGPCVNEYACDYYWVTVVDQAAYTDTNHVYHPAVTHQEERHHECPYTNHEYTFDINTTLGVYTIASGWVAQDANSDRWDSGVSVPGDIPRGVPSFWLAAKARIAAGDPGPVTAQRDYTNYILASQQTLLHTYSPSIANYQRANLLPDINHSLIDPYYLNRAYFVGVSGVDQSAWQAALNKFDAAFGADLQGNLYVVVVNSDAVNKVGDPDDYAMALTAYWERPGLDKFQISKNGVIVVLGTKDGKTVDWARATTGMPNGNEVMLRQIENQMPGTALTADAVLGSPTASISVVKGKDVVTVHHTHGALESIMWGPNKFARVHMGSFQYLSGEIQPSSGQYAVIYVIMFVLSMGIWGGLIYLGVSSGSLGGDSLQQRRRGTSGTWS